jgi:hypothetical protein
MLRKYELTDDFKFSYSVEEFDEITTTNYLEAIDKTTKVVFDDCKKANLNKIGLCLSGSDSEFIAHFLHKNDIPTEYFFMDIGGINSEELKLCEQISKKYNTKLNVVSVNTKELLDNLIYENFDITHVCWPTYSTLPTLIKNIPKDFYIVLGEGDLEKGWPRYKELYYRKIEVRDNDFFHIPIMLTEISYLLSLSFFGKRGEGNFYSRCYDTWYHILNDKRLIVDDTCLLDPKTNIISEYKKQINLLSPMKTMNYDDHMKRILIGDKIINNLIRYGKKIENWSPIIGDILKIKKESKES